MRTNLTRLTAAITASILLVLATASPAAANNSGSAPVPSGETPPIDGTGPAVSDPSAFGSNCIRIDLLPGYGPNLTLQYSYDTVIMSDGVTNAFYYNVNAGATIFTASGNGLVYVIKCGFGGFGNYARGDVTVIAAPALIESVEFGEETISEQVITFSVDGCQPGATATALLDEVVTKSFVVPPSGFLTGSVVAPTGAPASGTLTAECSGYRVTVPLDGVSLDLIVGAGGAAPIAPDTSVVLADGGGSVTDTEVSSAGAGATADQVPTTVSADQAAISAAAATDGAVSITLASEPDRSFSLAELDLVNPAAVETVVTAIAGSDGGVDFVVGSAPIVGDVAAAAAVDAAGSLGSSASLARIAIGGVSALGLAAFLLRRRVVRVTPITTA